MSDIIENFSTRLESALRLRNMKSVELHEKTGISESLISKYLSNNATARQDKLVLISNVLNINPVWLMGYDVPMENSAFVMKKNLNTYGDISENKHAFPLLGTVKAGYDYFASENIIGYVSVDKKVNDVENCYALQITGDSMQPVLYEDDIIIIHKQDDVENGQVAIILIDNEEATVKKIIKHENYIELVAFNSYYPPKKLTKEDNFKIIGKVIEGRINKIFE